MASTNKRTLIGGSSISASVTTPSTGIQDVFTEFCGFLKSENSAGVSIAVKIQHSPNLVDWFDLVTFTAVAGDTVEKIDVSEIVFPNIRADVAHTSGSCDLTVELYHRQTRS